MYKAFLVCFFVMLSGACTEVTYILPPEDVFVDQSEDISGDISEEVSNPDSDFMETETVEGLDTNIETEIEIDITPLEVDAPPPDDVDSCPHVFFSACGENNGCYDLRSSLVHCGACGNSCNNINQECYAGTCRCSSELTACGDLCVDTAQDKDHCGGCGIECVGAQECIDGVCNAHCPEGTEDCEGECVYLHQDNAHCGSCGNICDGDLHCIDGACSCPYADMDICGNTCADLDNDSQHCGSCGHVCSSIYPRCVSGMCMPPCDQGFTLCGGECVDLRTDTNHCNQCYNSCIPPFRPVCVDGECVRDSN